MSSLSLDDLRQIEELVEQFEVAWRRGERPRVEDYITGLPDRLRASLVQQLVPVEIELRRGQGERTTDEEFRARLPEYVDAVGEVLGWTWGARGEMAAPPSARGQEGVPPNRAHWPRLRGYLFLEAIGAGAMGVVYKAWQTRLGRNVAIKVIAPDAPKARFRREARLIARIRSPHVVSVHDYVDCDDGRGLLIMDYIDGFDCGSRWRWDSRPNTLAGAKMLTACRPTGPGRVTGSAPCGTCRRRARQWPATARLRSARRPFLPATRGTRFPR
jgi:hypothetical protein